MRLVILSLALALTASAPLAAEVQAPVSVQPLAAGEVLLEVNALGTVSSRADRATMTVSVSGSGATEAEARAATQAAIRDVRTALRRLGVAETDIRAMPVTTSVMASTMDMMDANMTMDAMDNAASEAGMVTSSASGQAQVEIVIRNVDRVPAVQEALMERGIYAAVPLYVLTDDSGPRRQARAQALAKAQADAEAYAASLNMRVVRVVRVSERLGLDMLGLFASEMQSLGQIFATGAMMRGPEVQTFVTVGVDYALAPR